MILIKRICFIIVLLVFYTIIIRLNTKDVFSEKIDLNLKDEIGVIVYKYSDLAFILEIDGKLNRLILFSYNDSFNKIKNVFNLNEINELISFEPYLKSKKYYNLNSNFKLSNFYKENNLYILKLYNYNFCIVNEPNLLINNCTFTYFNDIYDGIEFNDSNKVVFYSNTVSDDFKEMIYTKWLDIYELNNLNYTILKVKKDSYNIINIPV